MDVGPGSAEGQPDWMMRPDICPVTGQHLCRICGVLLVSAASFNTHRIRKHGTIRHTMICPIGRDKCAKQVNMDKMRQHLLKDHDFQSVLEKRSFASKDDFLKWKEEVELATSAYFIKNSFDGVTNDYYNCNRSGNSGSQERRSAKSKANQGQNAAEASFATAKKPKKRVKGSAKMGAHCPATITVHYDQIGQAFVEAYLTHVGHELDLRHLPVPKALRERVRTLLQLGNDTNQVLRTLKREAVPGDRTAMITGSLVRDVRRLDQEGINAGHLDANYLLVQSELVVEMRPSEEWLVQSSKNDQQFSVTRTEFGCPNEECHIRCDHCRICPHLYNCSCVQSAHIAHLPCMHIHGVHALREQHAFDAQVPAELIDVSSKRSDGDSADGKTDGPESFFDDPDNQEVIVVVNEDSYTTDSITPPANDYSCDSGQNESNQATMMAIPQLAEEKIEVAESHSANTTEIVAASERPAEPNKKAVAALHKLNALEKRLVLKIAKWKTMWASLPAEMLLEASESGDLLEEILNDSLCKAQSALPEMSQATSMVPALSTTPTALPPPIQGTDPLIPVHWPNRRKRNLLTSDYFREKARRDAEWMQTRNAAGHDQPQHDTVISEQQEQPAPASTACSSAERVVFDRNKFPFAKVNEAPKGVPYRSPTAIINSASAASPGKPPGRVIVLQYSKKSSNGLTTIASGQKLRPIRIRPMIRCVACKRVIGSNHLLAKKCVKCDQWCHRICVHSCAA